MKKQEGIGRVISAFFNSVEGIKAAWQHEAAFRQELILGAVLLVLIPFLPISLTESILLALTVLIVWVTELLNSGLEWTIDYISKARHPYAKRVKDMGSAAVFFALLLLGLTWMSVLWNCLKSAEGIPL
ncbi:MAG: diacylglycerol kinase [Opitutales bacterium]